MAGSSSSSSDQPFPEGSNPENRVKVPSALCSFGARTQGITGFLRQVFAQHLCDPDNIENPFLRRKLMKLGPWKPDEPDNPNFKPGGIQIESVMRWKPETTEQRPAIIIKRHAWKWVSRIIGDNVKGDNFPDQMETYVGWWQGSHTIFAISREGAEAEQLGFEVARILILYREMLQTNMHLDRFVLVQVDEVKEIEEATENYAVPVTVAYEAQENWRLVQNVPRLKSIVIKASDLLDY